jgi:putative endonuclease
LSFRSEAKESAVVLVVVVYYERFGYIRNAIARETELKDWSRDIKIELIEQTNPTWDDLAANW